MTMMAVKTKLAAPTKATRQATAPAPFPDALLADLDELGLTPSQARVLLALMELGSAHSAEVARLAGIPRTAVYPVLQELAARRLVTQVGSEGRAIWASPGRQEVLELLGAAHEDRLRRERERMVRVQSTMESLFPATATSLPLVHVIPSVGQAKDAYDQLLADTDTELLVLSGPPYTSGSGAPMNPEITELLDRGVEARVLFDRDRFLAYKAARREDIEAYLGAGVQARILQNLPVKQVVSDRKAVLAAIPDTADPDSGFPMGLLVKSERYAGVQATAFEAYWAAAKSL